MATLKSLGWDLETPPPRPDRTDTEMLQNAGGNVTVFEGGQAWVKSDMICEVRQ